MLHSIRVIVILLDVPESPGPPSKTDTTSTSISLQWDKPTDNGGRPITGYLVEKFDGHSDTWTMLTMSPTKNTTYTATNLVKGRQYQFRVSAVNDAGQSKPSMISKVIFAAGK